MLDTYSLYVERWATPCSSRPRPSRGGRPQPAQPAAIPRPADTRGAPHPKEDTMKELQLPQGTIRYRDAGNGSPIVLVHGLLANGELWRDVAPLLAADHRVI